MRLTGRVVALSANTLAAAKSRRVKFIAILPSLLIRVARRSHPSACTSWQPGTTSMAKSAQRWCAIRRPSLRPQLPKLRCPVRRCHGSLYWLVLP
jgi:hypothetical protein